MGFPGGASGEEHAYQCRGHKRCSWIPGSGRFPGGGQGNQLQYSFLENPMDIGAGQLKPTVSQRVRHDLSDLACTHAYLPGGGGRVGGGGGDQT